MDYTTVPIDNYSTPGFATSTNYDVPPPVVYAYGGVQPEKNYSIPTIVFSSISLVWSRYIVSFCISNLDLGYFWFMDFF